MVTGFRSSNPTWIRFRKSTDEALSANWETIRLKLLESYLILQSEISNPKKDSYVDLRVAPSTQLPPDLPSASLVITSPPYCTRIDYVAATRPELAVLGYTLKQQDDLKRKMLGTTAVPKAVDRGRIGETAELLLGRIASHSTKASSTYYTKWITQYMLDYSQSLDEITRHTKSNAALALVVQDSYYKDIQIDLQTISEEMLGQRGWRLVKAHDYVKRASMAGVNKEARKYRTEFSTKESALIFRKIRDCDAN
jgi:hypothetical protein